MQWVPVVPPWVLRKSATPYVIASLFVPGLGSLLLGRVRNGVVLLGVTVACWVTWMVVVVSSINSLPPPTVTPTLCHGEVCSSLYVSQVSFPHGLLLAMLLVWPFGLAAWVLGIVDALRGTREWNRSHGLPE